MRNIQWQHHTQHPCPPELRSGVLAYGRGEAQLAARYDLLERAYDIRLLTLDDIAAANPKVPAKLPSDAGFPLDAHAEAGRDLRYIRNAQLLSVRGFVGEEGPVISLHPLSGYLRRQQPKPVRPISMIYVAGAADPLVPLEGGVVESPWGELEERPPVIRSVETWAAWLGCPPEPQLVSDRGGVRRVRYGPGEQGGEVEFVTIADAGHVGPGGPAILAERIAGPTTDKLNATDTIWEFFERHPAGTTNTGSEPE